MDDLLAAQLLTLVTRCSDRFDAKDHRAFAACFTEAGTMVTSGGELLHGRTALMDFSVDWHRENAGTVKHTTSEHRFTLDTAGICGGCTVWIQLISVLGAGPVLQRWYADGYEFQGGWWRIRERRVLLAPTGTEPVNRHWKGPV